MANETNERWVEIQGNREIYMISDAGNVKTKDRIGARGYFVKGHDLKQHFNSNGYLRFGANFGEGEKDYLVHRLVAQYFVPNDDAEKTFVNHKDGDKTNNSADNLEWCTKSENETHAHSIGLKTANVFFGEEHPQHKLTQEQVEYIRANHKPFDKEYGSVAMARLFGVQPQTITDIVHGRSWAKGV